MTNFNEMKNATAVKVAARKEVFRNGSFYMSGTLSN